MASQAVLELLIALKDQASSGIASIGSALGSLGTVGLGVAAGGIAAVGAALVSGIGDAREANQLLASTEQTIKSTGGAAGLSAKQVTDLATAMSAASGKSLFGDSDIQAAENMLLTFTNIGKDVFPAATQATVDMAAAFHTTPAAFDQMIGKALNSAEGFTALKRSGVAFTDSQEAMIKKLFETGHAAEAQKIILAELNTEFGGQAEAAAKADGGWAQFKDRMGEAAETAGAAVLPLLTMLAAFLNDPVMPAIEMVAAAFAAWLGDPATQAGIQALGDTISTVLGAAFDFIANTALPALLTAWGGLQPAIAVVIATVGEFLGSLQPVVDFIGANLQPILYGLAAIFLTVVVPAFVAWATAAAITAAANIAAFAPVVLALAAIGAAVALLKAAWDSDFGGIRTTLTAFWEGTASPVLSQLATWLGVNVPAAVSTVAGFFTGTLWPALQKVWAFLDANIIPILGALANVWIALVKKEIELLAALWNNVLWPALQKVGAFIDDTVVPALTRLSQDAMNGAKVASDALATVVNTVLGPAFQWLSSNVIGPVTSGFGHISSAVGDVIGFLKRLADSINAIEIPAWLQGHSPPPLADWFDAIGASITGVANDALPGFGDALSSVGSSIASTARSIGGPLQDAVSDLGGIFSRSRVPDAAKSFGEDVLAGIGEGMESATAHALGIGEDAKQTIGNELGKLPDAMPDVGEATVDGIQKGVENNWDGFRNWMGNRIGDELVDWVKSKLGISSPSTVFAGIGSDILAGLIDGMAGSQSALDTVMSGIIDQLEDQLATLRTSLERASGATREAIQGQIDNLQASISTMTTAAAKLPDLIAAATEGMYNVTANIYRQQERNMERLPDFALAQRAQVEASLEAAEAAAKLIPDPAEAAEFFKLRSKQIFELADLEKEMANVGVAERKKLDEDHAKTVADLDKESASLQTQLANAKTDEERAAIQEKIDANTQARQTEASSYASAIEANRLLTIQERARYAARIDLVRKAQKAEQDALKTHQANTQSVFEQMRAGVEALLKSIPSGIQLPANWTSTITAYRNVLAQLNRLYSLSAPQVFMSSPTPATGSNAAGTDFWRGGLTWVGERGRELVNLPRGSQVIPNNESERLATGGGGVVFQAGAIALTLPNTSESEARRFVDRVIGEIDRRRRGRG